MDLNFLQRLTQPQGQAAMQPGQTPPYLPAPQPVMQDAPEIAPRTPIDLSGALGPAPNLQPDPAPQPQASAPPRERRSILDTIGRLSDVFAKVGGADALYQPTLDSREDRQMLRDDRAQTMDFNRLKLALTGQQVQAGQGELGDAENARLGQAIRGFQAIVKANPNADTTKLWPLLARQAGLSDERAAVIGSAIHDNPELITGLSRASGAPQEFGLQPFYAKDAKGNLQAYQVGKDGTVQPITLPDGTTPIDPSKFVDLGDRMAGVGSRSGNVTTVLPKGERPGSGADRASRERIARDANATRTTIAGMPARGKAGTTPAGGDTRSPSLLRNARDLVSELSGLYDDLDRRGAIVGAKGNSGVGNILARLGSSGAGQIVEGTIGTEAQATRDRINSIRPLLLQNFAKLLGATGKQLDSNSDVQLWLKALGDPSQNISAVRRAINGLQGQLREARVAAAPAADKPAPRRNLPPKITVPGRTAPAQSGGWGKASVVGK